MKFSSLQKYTGFFLMEFQRAQLYLTDFVIRGLLIVLRLAMPYSVFVVLVNTGRIPAEQANALLWAVLVGQILTGSIMRLHLKIHDDIRTGNISIRLSEPVNYMWAKIFQSLGYFLPMFTVYAVVFFTACYFLFPTNINFVTLLLFMALSVFLVTTFNVIVGLLSFVLEEVEGVYWILQKMFFIFGNQVIPVALMPAAVITFARYTPFYLGFAGPIEAASGRLDVMQGVVMTVIYIILFLFIGQLMLNKLQKRLVMNG